MDAGVGATFTQLQSYEVNGAWMLEYCGVAFGSQMEDDLPILPNEADELLKSHYLTFEEFEKQLISRLPKWRAEELRNYLAGLPHRPFGPFNAWIIFETPSRRCAVMAKLITEDRAKEVLLGYPAPSKYRPKTHSFFPVMVVDDSVPRRRVGSGRASIRL
jgi:hypothetical protein